MKILNNLNLLKNELQNAAIQNLAEAPASPVSGQVYFDTVSDELKIYNGAAWDTVGKEYYIAVVEDNGVKIRLTDSLNAADDVKFTGSNSITITKVTGEDTINIESPNLSLTPGTGDYVSGLAVSGHGITETKVAFSTLTASTGLTLTDGYNTKADRTVALTNIKAGDNIVGAIQYVGTATPVAGKFDSNGTAGVDATLRLNYNGVFNASNVLDRGDQVVAAIATTGAGNVITSATKSGRTVTFDKGITALTQVKVLNTTATTTQTTVAEEAINGAGTITLHEISKTGSWGSLLNKPTSAVADIDDAVGKRHTQNTSFKSERECFIHSRANFAPFCVDSLTDCSLI
jgi:hypothetical protein